MNRTAGVAHVLRDQLGYKLRHWRSCSILTFILLVLRVTLIWISGAINIPTSPTSSVTSLTTSTEQAKGLQQVSRFQNRFQHRVVRIQGSSLWTHQ